MAKKQVDGDGLDIPNRIKALPVKRTGPIVAAIIVALFAAMLVQALVTNPRFEWNVVWKYLFNENVLEGIKYTLLLTVIDANYNNGAGRSYTRSPGTHPPSYMCSSHRSMGLSADAIFPSSRNAPLWVRLLLH